MQNFEFKCQAEIIFGKKAEDKTAEKVQKYGGTRVFVVYGGGSVIRSGLLAKIERQLQELGIKYELKGGVKPNPTLAFAREGVKEAVAFGADMVLGVGGGSVIDTAKAVAHGAANPETDLWDFWTGKEKLTKSLPVGVVLTIAAAGSETSNSAVLTNEDTGKKSGINTEFNRPAFAIMNPELTYTLPPRQIACGVADIIMHTLERYFTKVEGNLFTDLVAEALIRNVVNNARIAMVNRKDYTAMSEIMWCGSVSHSNFTELGRMKDFSVHKLGHELSGKFDVPHGESLTAMWGSWARFVYEEDVPRFARYAEKVWDVNSGAEIEKARAGIRKTEDFFRELKLPTNFSELGIGVQDEATLNYLADMCTDFGKKTVAVFHPIDRETALKIYRAANR